MSQLLADKAIIITGGTRGIGLAIAVACLAEGARVLITGRSQESVDQALEKTRHPDMHGVAANVASEEDTIKVFELAIQKFGKVDMLVNNAGIARAGAVQNLRAKDFQMVMDTNLTGAFLYSREAFRVMKDNGGGRILNIGSISSQTPRFGSVPYTTSKFGLQGMTRALQIDGRELGIMVSCLHPGNVHTDIWDKAPQSVVDEPKMEVKDIARVAVLMLSMPDNTTIIDATVLDPRQPFLGRG
ncbi:SDR family oxidoreductase [Pseudohongiella spirulinae]|uniref:Short-chain dehydrogenase/reductase SDR n=1 Tax=Pseudohongiella spirulinae TaxID=1249552 RepID=A0A0S2K916_9GAMM|nr:SDR family oxidoreductase [Pseudohongiella spirulinae]ALO44828.1 short-chain dehydrogenase/reductase SDR [Pseudohongiella spirulinae]